ncbi:MAG: hypothetical protein CMK65_11590 [Pseudoalteromonas sp.]|uniref:KAP family P-loop NTPase fold protein n=1 Tax=Pseudoalteromonas sp. TaxID=53249 RepID=UPI000C8AC6EC|nr:P-loop NTPase fold protein [Pseudoalteromonas sp.]MAD04243.1 hypothetical protein [Pseudoalteromonas sp.]|tara:strand:- start:6939 stop:8402 length:1464 start_codon:yes stop_codon:yes gene_type:complete
MGEDKFLQWKKDYSFEECKLGRKPYGEFLSSYIRTQNSPLVLNLDGSWGVGKSHFLRQLYSDLRFKHYLPVIHIDAWVSDFSDDPLLVIISELLEQMALINTVENSAQQEKIIFEYAAKYSKKAWNLLAITGGVVAAGVINNGAAVEIAKNFTFSDSEYQEVGKKLNEIYQQQKEAIEEIKTSLNHFAELYERQGGKVFILIDELDRCRPNYAIEFLEVIKHFFDLKDYVFVIATDTEQLSKSIKAIYGSEFNGKEYLTRFFARTAKIPQPDFKAFALLLLNNSIIVERIERLFLIEDENSAAGLAHIFSVVACIYDLSLRKFEQLFAKYESIVMYCDNHIFDSRLLLQLICEFEDEFYRDSYDLKRRVRKLNHYELTEKQKTIKGYNLTHSIDLAFKGLSRDRQLEFEGETNLFKEAYKFAYLYGKVVGSRTDSNVMFAKTALNESYNDNKEYFLFLNALKPHDNNAKFWTINDYFKYIELAHEIE